MKSLKICTAAAALAFTLAAFGTAGAAGMSHAMKAAHPAGTLGAHAMPSTVTKVNHKTGMVDVTSMGMHLAVHFPPPTIKGLQAGDKILLHLAYSYGG
ncbi:MAG TPA: hypothetical protein VND80_08995 [Steroidobacteraceae bacterium]|nr:hypothetical protein [Steroidobacteraceae bacterium]